MRCRWTQGVLNFQNKGVEKEKRIWPKESCHRLSAIEVSMSSKRRRMESGVLRDGTG